MSKTLIKVGFSFGRGRTLHKLQYNGSRISYTCENITNISLYFLLRYDPVQYYRYVGVLRPGLNSFLCRNLCSVIGTARHT